MKILLIALLSIIAISAVAARGDVVTGRVSVIDGDTVDIRAVRFRLHGVDAPESSQTCKDARGAAYRCGAVAANRLSEKIGVLNVACTETDRDRYGRVVAVCRSSGEDLNAWLVSEGLAVAYRKYSLDYVGLEDKARAARRGLWAGSFQMPSEYRATPNAQPSASSSKPRFATCAAARAAGVTPLIRGTPNYNPALDRDKDGKACE